MSARSIAAIAVSFDSLRTAVAAIQNKPISEINGKTEVSWEDRVKLLHKLGGLRFISGFEPIPLEVIAMTLERGKL